MTELVTAWSRWSLRRPRRGRLQVMHVAESHPRIGDLTSCAWAGWWQEDPADWDLAA